MSRAARGGSSSFAGRGAAGPLFAAWNRWYWAIAWLVTLVGLWAFWTHATPHLCHAKYWLSGDSGLAVYNAWQVADGRVLYRDVFEYRPPLYFWTWGALMWLVGPSAWASQIATIVTTSAVAPLVAVAARRLGTCAAWAAIGGVVPPLICFAVWPFAYPYWMTWPLVGLTAWALARAFVPAGGGGGVSERWLIGAGALTGLHVLTIQTSGLCFALGAFAGIVLVAPARRWRLAGLYAAGGLAAAVPVVLVLAARGVLDDAIWHVFVWPNAHYYNGQIKGHYPFAGVAEHFVRHGSCKVGVAPIRWTYTASVLAIPALGSLGLVASVAAIAGLAWRRLRGTAAAAWNGASAGRIVLASAGAIAFLPTVVFSALSDPVHFGFAALAPAVPLVAILGAAPRWPRRAGRVVLGAMLVIALVVTTDRWLRYGPMRAKVRDFDAFVGRWAGAEWLAQLTEPGDTVVFTSYGGWQYLARRRHSGLSWTFVFDDDKLIPKREWARMVKDIETRKPALMSFADKRLEARFFRMDPTLKGKRYFWNGVAWERKDPPAQVETLAKRYRGTADRARDTLELTQKGQELKARRIRPGAPVMALEGSIRGRRVWLTARGERLLLRLGTDGILEGQCVGKACKWTPEP